MIGSVVTLLNIFFFFRIQTKWFRERIANAIIFLVLDINENHAEVRLTINLFHLLCYQDVTIFTLFSSIEGLKKKLWLLLKLHNGIYTRMAYKEWCEQRYTHIVKSFANVSDNIIER